MQDRFEMLTKFGVGCGMLLLLAACSPLLPAQVIVESNIPQDPLPPLEIGSLEAASRHSIVIAIQSVPGRERFVDVLICIPRASNTPTDAHAKFAVHLRDGEHYLFSITVDPELGTEETTHEMVGFAVDREFAGELSVDLLYFGSGGLVTRANFRSLYVLNLGPILRALEDEDLEFVLGTRCASDENPTKAN